MCLSQGAAVELGCVGSKRRVVVVKSESSVQDELQIVSPWPEATMAKLRSIASRVQSNAK